MILMRLPTLNSYDFQILDWGKLRGVVVAMALGSFAASHNLCPTVACGVGAKGQSWCLQCILPRRAHPHDKI